MICPLSKSGSPAAPGSSTNPTRPHDRRGRPSAAHGSRSMAGGDHRRRPLAVARQGHHRCRRRLRLLSIALHCARRRGPLRSRLASRAPPPSRRGASEQDAPRPHASSQQTAGHTQTPAQTPARGVDCRSANTSSSRRPSASGGPSAAVAAASARSPGSTDAPASSAPRTPHSARRGSRLQRRCPDQLPVRAPARRSRPATSGTSCEVPHAPERPVGGPSDARYDPRRLGPAHGVARTRHWRASPPAARARGAAGNERFRWHSRSPSRHPRRSSPASRRERRPPDI